MSSGGSSSSSLGGGSDTDSVSVALRVRPLVKSEIERGCRIAVQRACDGSAQVMVNRTDGYTYNYVFDSTDSQQFIYEQCVHAKLRKLLAGYNVTILAYGQTGSGKTYTMGTAFNGVMDEHVGVIPRAVKEIFEMIEQQQESITFQVTCSFVELYQEQFFDLFSANRREDSTVDIREDKNQGIVMPGLTQLVVKSATEVTEHLMRGSEGRAVASTAMNESSSRSHAIFTITVVASNVEGKKSVTTSKFNLVDLAGSERCSKTLASGDRFKEGVNINKGLLALGNVINVLGSGQTSGYVPYRQSKLTRLLQDSLGGNSITLMIACVSPADYNVAETVSTLRYADRALQIKNKPVVNVDPHAAEVNALKDVIQKLRVEILALGGGGGGGSSGLMSSSLNRAVAAAGLESLPQGDHMAEQRRLELQVQQLEQRNRKLQQELHQALLDLTENEMRAHIAEQNQEKMKQHLVELNEKLALKPHDEQWLEINQMVSQAQEDLQRSESELQACHSLTSSVELPDIHQPASEEYTNKQLTLNGELRSINRQLSLKQELHERVCRNFQRFERQPEEEEDDSTQYEAKIVQLEAERCQLEEELRSVKSKDSNAARLAEERRKKLQVLEQDLAELRRKLQTQSNLLKMREKEREKIQNLGQEIRAMKESKVRLIRAMRQESEKFRQWKLVREKELTQLKSKDRKMQSEMVKQQQLHSKQRQVLKRKCEEALATNKRLKDALERQASAQAQRQRQQGGTGAGKRDAWIEQELEIILSLIDVEVSLDQLMEDRAIITKHHQQTQDPQVKASLEEELEMRQAQIADLQQKMQHNDLDKRLRSLAENVQSLGESRSISKQLLKTLVQQRRELHQNLVEHRARLDDLSEAQQQQEELSKRLQLAESQYQSDLMTQQRLHEEKLEILLRQDKKTSSKKQPTQPVKYESSPFVEEDSITEAEVGSESESVCDPDWKPAERRSKKSGPRDSTSSAAVQPDANNLSSSKRCKCRTKCDTKRCGCLASESSCSISCKCKGSCHNPHNTPSSPPGSGDETVKENADTTNLTTPPPPPPPLAQKMQSPAKRSSSEVEAGTTMPDIHGPKLAKMSGLSFSTTPRRKFFEN